jgi:hypothetical protein
MFWRPSIERRGKEKLGALRGPCRAFFLCAIGSVGQERPASEASFQLGLSRAPANLNLPDLTQLPAERLPT